MHAHPLLFIASERPNDAPGALENLATHWGRLGVLERVSLGPLDDSEMAILLAAHAVDPTIRPRVQSQSAGNPYFAIELARAESADIPLGLADLLRGRLAKLLGDGPPDRAGRPGAPASDRVCDAAPDEWA